MKVLHINYTDKAGGAAIAAYRHHEALRNAGIDSKMLILSKTIDDPYVIAHNSSYLKHCTRKVLNKLFFLSHPFFGNWSWNHFGYDFSHDKEVEEADVIILHWITRYTLSLKSIGKILKTGKPVYWFMHDMWPITGGCHYALDCEKYKTHCEACPMANNGKGTAKIKDVAWRQFEEKYRRLRKYNNLFFLTPSKWLADRVKESALFGNHSVGVVRNVLDTDVFKPVDKEEARKRLGLPLDKKLILFGADSISSPYKGWDKLKEVLKEPIADTEVVIYGHTSRDVQSEIGMKLHSMGRIESVEKLIDLYSACDISSMASKADNYPNVIIESMACGLPVIGFSIGGITEMIGDNETGYLIPPYDCDNYRRKLEEFLNLSEDERKLISHNCREAVVRTNSYEALAWPFLKK